jgi:hypothetical protein
MTATEVAGIGAFGASVVLAGLAYVQIRQARGWARAQLQPVVLAYPWGATSHLMSDEPQPWVVRYYLRNDGLGPALDVEHGIEADGLEIPWFQQEPDGGGARYRTVIVGESLPPGYPPPPNEAPQAARLLEIPMESPPQQVAYWTRFSNAYGERFVTRNYFDPSRPAELRRLSWYGRRRERRKAT